MNESEAEAVVRQELLSPDGLRARIRNGSGLDERALTRVESALAALSDAWRGRSEVPKWAAQALSDVGGDFDVRGYAPADQQAHRRAGARLEALAEALFADGAAPPALADEDAALLATVVGSLRGPDALPARLARGDGLDRARAAALVGALGQLTQAWRDRSTVPKVLAAALVRIYGPLYADHVARYADADQRALEDNAVVVQDLATSLFDDQS